MTAAPTPRLMVDLRSVGRTYGSGHAAVTALRDVSLQVSPGEMVALIGRSGSGKTTLLNIIGGLDRPDHGEVIVDGTDVAHLDDTGLERMRRETVAFIFQSFGLVPELSAAENVGLPLRLRRRLPPTASGERRCCSTSSGSASTASTAPTRCPVARCSGSPSHALSRAPRGC